ncbi:MAG: methionine adenosyltransferase [Ignavibacterium album]|uniref:methionine adenosyltransferase n=1 Tax=Ignavibacterium album TaxID=591197 RepID=UPI0026F3062A|nr:methionine adenosyltransferase [Ignavibacterium album]MCX8106711.1 methionine adenosyltransferase [Ignavibacterium album]
MKEYEFTSESVSEGHPDKVADQISDAILDDYLEKDSKSRVAVETMIAKNLIVIAGEISSNAEIDYRTTINDVLKSVGYTNDYNGFDSENYELITSITKQSEDISDSLFTYSEKLGAGDQGMMFGYAVNETESLMPLPIFLAHLLMMDLSKLRKSGKYDFLLPDAKSQVTVRYSDGVPVEITKIILSTQHSEFIHKNKLREIIIEEVIRPSIPPQYKFDIDDCIVNPTERFVNGGPLADVGLTGRKIIVDSYGGSCPHGGGAFSGKDASKVDRSGAYMARYIAKNIVASGMADKCTVQIAYVIGQPYPVSLYLNFHDTGKIDEELLINEIPQLFDLTPDGIIREFRLNKPIFRKTAAYGHFGRDEEDFLWERTDKAEILTQFLN